MRVLMTYDLSSFTLFKSGVLFSLLFTLRYLDMPSSSQLN